MYCDYYVYGGSHGKAVLQHNEKLKTAAKERRIVKLHRYETGDYVIFDEGFGVFSVENY